MKQNTLNETQTEPWAESHRNLRKALPQLQSN
jgi:hypothetical protein